MVDDKVFYYCVHSRIVNIVDKLRTDEIKRKEIFTILGKEYHIPREYKNMVLKNMCKISLFENMGAGKIKVIKGKNKLFGC